MQTFVVDIDGPVFAVDHGGEGRPIVLVHGLGGSHHNWGALVPHIRHLGHVYALDLSGFGRTPPAGRGATVDANQRLLHGFLEHLASTSGLAVRPLIVGNSMGGLVSMLQASRHPDSVEALALISPAAPSWDPQRLDPTWMALSTAYMLPGIGRIILEGYERSRTPRRRISESFSVVSADPSLLAPLYEDHVAALEERRTLPWALDAWMQAYRSTMLTIFPLRFDRMVQSITARTLLVHGTQDQVVPFASAERLAGLRPQWTFIPYEGFGHVAQMEAPQRLADDIEALALRTQPAAS
jgi:pimeloyl-ACP methyl ester carboxylesterase